MREILKIWLTGFRLPKEIVSLGESCPERPNKQPCVENNSVYHNAYSTTRCYWSIGLLVTSMFASLPSSAIRFICLNQF